MRVLFAVFTIDVIVVRLIMDGFIVSRIKMATKLSTKVGLCTHFSCLDIG